MTTSQPTALRQACDEALTAVRTVAGCLHLAGDPYSHQYETAHRLAQEYEGLYRDIVSTEDRSEVIR